jgi:hypothetical protein
MILGLPVMAFSVLAGLSLFAASMSYARGLDTSRIAPAIATVFGLAHGAGFAGPLLEMKIMPGDLVWTLLAFNIGLELGQLVILCVVLTMGAALVPAILQRRRWVQILVGVTGGLALMLLVQRLGDWW